MSRDGFGWEVETPTASYRAQRVTLACAPRAQLTLLENAGATTLPPPAGAVLDADVVLGLVVSPELDRYPLGSGALVSEHRHPRIKSTTHVNAKWDWINSELDNHAHIIRLSTRGNPSSKLSPHAIVSEGLSDLYAVSRFDIIDVGCFPWPGSLIRPHRTHTQWVQSHLSRWEEMGLSVRGALTGGNGLLGIARDRIRRASP